VKETKLTDEELKLFLHELGLYDKIRVEKKRGKTPIFQKVETKGPSKIPSLKISLFITLSLFLFTLVQASFTLPLYMRMRKVESALQSLTEETKKISPALLIPEECFPVYPEEEIIDSLESEETLYKNA
jgi:hypothetical protein